MIVDTSAIMAILLAEPDAAIYQSAIFRAEVCRVSAATYVEMHSALRGRVDARAITILGLLLRRIGAVIEPFTHDQALLANDAFALFGKGIHPAGLNFGDCFSYSLAKATGEPLLFKGNDFAQTDVRSALSS